MIAAIYVCTIAGERMLLALLCLLALATSAECAHGDTEHRPAGAGAAQTRDPRPRSGTRAVRRGHRYGRPHALAA